MIPILCKYSKPKIIPARINRIFSSSFLANYAPLDEFYSVKDIKSPPGAIGPK